MKTIDSLVGKSVPVRCYFTRDIAERLSALCDASGCSFSTIVNAAAKVALRNRDEIIEDAKGVKTSGWIDTHNKG